MRGKGRSPSCLLRDVSCFVQSRRGRLYTYSVFLMHCRKPSRTLTISIKDRPPAHDSFFFSLSLHRISQGLGMLIVQTYKQARKKRKKKKEYDKNQMAKTNSSPEGSERRKPGPAGIRTPSCSRSACRDPSAILESPRGFSSRPSSHDFSGAVARLGESVVY